MSDRHHAVERDGRRRPRRGLHLVGVAAATTALLAACTSDRGLDGADGADAPGRPAPEWPVASFASALEPFDSCDALTAELQQVALDHVGPYGLEGLEVWAGGVAPDVAFEAVGRAVDDAGAPATTAAPQAAEANRTAGDGGTSDTNVQVVGVDEADTVEIVGDTLYSVVDGQLRILDVAADTPVELGSTDLAAEDLGAVSSILVDGDRVLAIADGWDGAVPLDGGISFEEATRFAPGPPTVELASIDVADPSAPEVVQRWSIDGSLLGARMVAGTARVVTAGQPPDLAFVQPSGPGSEAAAEEANRAIIEDTTAEDWLPRLRTLEADGEVAATGPVAGCAAVSRPGVFSGTGTVAVTTVDVDQGTLDPEDSVAVQATGDTIYADADTLYVATYGQIDPDGPVASGGVVTSVHAFDITGDGPATYQATGEVPGHLLDQFALDEHDGALRVATTTDGSGPLAAESLVTTLERRDGDLVQIGQVGGLGPTEQIRSVRFLGDVGYVVTFRQTDPLYTVDLADPATPTVVGELKIPGFSSYLHPIGEGRLLGIGQDATDEGRVTGAQVSLFDVSDPASPERLQTWQRDGASSMAEGDHHAFLWWAEEDLLVIPASFYDPALEQNAVGGWFDGAVALDVADGGIAERGRVQHLVEGGGFECPPNARCVQPLVPDCGPGADCAVIGPAAPVTDTTVAPCDPDLGCEGPLPVEPGIPAPPVPTASPVPIQRTLVVDGRLVTVSTVGVAVSSLDDLTPLGWLRTG